MSGAVVAGVDFSGGSAAGRTTWVALGRDDGESLVIESLEPAMALPGGAAAREAAHGALVRLLCELSPAVAAFDFPFGLPRALVEGNDWRAWLERFAGAHASPEAFRAWCRGRSAGKEWKRRTDREEKTPMCVYNLRLHRQTFFGLRDVAAPLIDQGMRAMPMQADGAAGGPPLLIETCPASLLRRAGLPTIYKGSDRAHRNARGAIVRWLEGARGVAWGSKRMREIALRDAGGDALDAAIASSSAAAARRGGLDLFRRDALDEDYRIEARVYCG